MILPQPEGNNSSKGRYILVHAEGTRQRYVNVSHLFGPNHALRGIALLGQELLEHDTPRASTSAGHQHSPSGTGGTGLFRRHDDAAATASPMVAAYVDRTCLAAAQGASPDHQQRAVAVG